ncbi:MAG: tRNA (adenosine(37)-N6)-threonylcarbamoyltransferase complex dimerization subunit type 1 TsaB [Verrucomicrobia bacterium]|nr:tRNA (adenosine(37)-N6)-threonylcarbamoyltransferase complex dimerization subunit type 1 TsaB [Verrucomicrobiota bacterium]MBT7700750.1 tRNA (adenosine(37)-N6)-threonylcarbamoyltransferase complex dimerization subunit type 1 TsaB [Verrucomicrobiota bacterium]
MLTLALEQSTPEAGIALLHDDALIALHSWREERKRDQNLFRVLPQLLTDGGVTLEAIDRFAVGLGPGSFSGIRIAIAALSALALPAGTPMAGVSSAAALARQMMPDSAGSSVAVIGDARRERLWMAVYQQDPTQETLPLCLIARDELRNRLPPGCRVVSPDWGRLDAVLRPLGEEGWDVIREVRTPTAEAVARLAAAQPATELATPLEPPQPLYLHPAVFVPPRFPVA